MHPKSSYRHAQKEKHKMQFKKQERLRCLHRLSTKKDPKEEQGTKELLTPSRDKEEGKKREMRALAMHHVVKNSGKV